jgi:hypothetical protein
MSGPDSVVNLLVAILPLLVLLRHREQRKARARAMARIAGPSGSTPIEPKGRGRDPVTAAADLAERATIWGHRIFGMGVLVFLAVGAYFDPLVRMILVGTVGLMVGIVFVWRLHNARRWRLSTKEAGLH